MTFEKLELIEPLQKALRQENYINPTPIQTQSIPPALKGRDIMGSAQTGTGKTAAFSLPILHHLYQKNSGANHPRVIRALIVTPTRELAIQIGESLTAYGRYTGLKNTVIFGGVGQGPQTAVLRKGIDILVATPGRLLDLMDQGFISLKHVEYFVLDEADRMLDMGFIHDIRKLLAKLPAKRQSLFFSATMPDSIVELSNTILSNPVKVAVNPVSSTAETIRQFVYYTNKADKPNLLLHILEDSTLNQVLVFTRTKHGADKIVRNLSQQKIRAAALHGNKSQNQRQKALGDFKDGGVRVLVATDIAARGIDIDQLKFVVNYDIPNIPETYVHRIGRSGRAGENGTAFSICEPEENEWMRDIQKLIGLKPELISSHPFPQTDKPMSPKEKQEAEREKQRRKQEFFANRKQQGNSGRDGSSRRRGR